MSLRVVLRFLLLFFAMRSACGTSETLILRFAPLCRFTQSRAPTTGWSAGVCCGIHVIWPKRARRRRLHAGYCACSIMSCFFMPRADWSVLSLLWLAVKRAGLVTESETPCRIQVAAIWGAVSGISQPFGRIVCQW